MKCSAIILLAMCVTAYGYCRKKLAQIPGGLLKFDPNRGMGKWYIQARLTSCSWSGSDKFEDWTQALIRDKHGVFSLETWRSNDMCATTAARVTQNQPGVAGFKVKDSFGGVWSGDQVIADTDFVSYAIAWGCAKRSVDGDKCADTWLTVKTRVAKPDPKTWKTIEASLNRHWDVSLTELRLVKHTDECPDSSQPKTMKTC